MLSFITMAQDNVTVLSGCFTVSYGYGGRKIEFDINGKFQIREYSCVGYTHIDSGFWKLNEDTSFFIQSSGFKDRFHLIHYDQYLFLISDAEKPSFTKDFSTLDKKYADGKVYGTKQWPATKSQMIYSKLRQNYFVRRL